MRLVRVVVRQVALGLLAAWAVLSLVFAFFTLTRDWVLEQRIGLLKFAGADQEALARAREAHLEARGLDRPIWEQYLDWMVDMSTFEWGTSLETGAAVFPLVTGAAARTALYVLPAIALAIVVGIGVGTYAAMYPDRRLSKRGLGTTYLLFAIPSFWAGGMLLSLARGDVIPYSPLVFEYLLPAALTATALLGGYVSYARAHASEYVRADFVRLVEAKGAGPARVARHVLRNAAIPLFSMLFTEALGLLVLAVFVVEFLFGIEGLGLQLFFAVTNRDVPVLLGGTMVVIAVGVLGNVIQDVSYQLLDPRVDTHDR